MVEKKTAAAKLGMRVLTLWMEVVRNMAVSVEHCREVRVASLSNSSTSSLQHHQTASEHAWDKAVAYYVGSLYRHSSRRDDGILLYGYANYACRAFRACGVGHNQTSGESFVNHVVLDKFREGQSLLLSSGEKDCDGLETARREIQRVMVIPLIQEMLRLFYTKSGLSGEQHALRKAEVLALEAALSPLVYACNANDAASLHSLVLLEQSSSTEFGALKALLERNYPCLVLSCHEIGGYANTTSGEYHPMARPCLDGSLVDNHHPPTGPPAPPSVSSKHATATEPPTLAPAVSKSVQHTLAPTTVPPNVGPTPFPTLFLVNTPGPTPLFTAVPLTPQPTTTSANAFVNFSSSSSIPMGGVVGIAIAGVVVALVVACWCRSRRRKNKLARQQAAQEEEEEQRRTEEGDVPRSYRDDPVFT